MMELFTNSKVTQNDEKDDISDTSTASLSDTDFSDGMLLSPISSPSKCASNGNSVFDQVEFATNVEKKVKFSLIVRVCLIPTRKEFCHVAVDLWWTLNECQSFKQASYFEIKSVVLKYGCSVHDAKRALYQPIRISSRDFTAVEGIKKDVVIFDRRTSSKADIPEMVVTEKALKSADYRNSRS